MTIDATVQRVIDDALDEKGFGLGELKYLFRVKPDSEEFAAMREAVDIIVKRHPQGTMLAQIGVDSQPCPGNCFHCSFSARYNTRPKELWYLPNEDVVDYAEDAVRRGTNVITLMLTAGYRFDKLLVLLDQIRERIGDEMPIMMNMGDFTYDQAVQMKEKGVTAIFHAVRMGEGLVTSIPLERRFETYAAANEVGFKIGASIENVTPIFTDDAIAEMMMRMRNEVHPLSCGCGSKRLVEGTAGFAEPDFPEEKLAVYQKSFRLLMSGVVTMFGSMYSECGRNPRDWVEKTEVNGLIKQRGTSHESLKKWMESEGFEMELEGPSKIWGF